MDYSFTRLFVGAYMISYSLPTLLSLLTLFLPQATYIMFHFVEGVPFESNSGVWDRLTMWEQIDGGEQYTPAKKWLTSLPICLWVVGPLSASLFLPELVILSDICQTTTLCF